MGLIYSHGQARPVRTFQHKENEPNLKKFFNFNAAKLFISGSLTPSVLFKNSIFKA